MEAARLREWYSAAQAHVAELSSTSADVKRTSSEELDVHDKHFNLYRLVHRIKKGAGKLKQGDSRAIWLERASTLQAEVHELTRGVVQNADQGLVTSLLAAGASATEALESEKAKLQESLQAAKYTCEALEATITEHAAAREQEAASLMELRTRTVVLQQDVRQREADARELVQRLQGAVREKELLAGAKERMEEDLKAGAQLAESQGQVIAQLMADSEVSKRELEGLWKRVKDSEQEAHVLRVNLGNHSQVIEKLILLNAEMMEAGNKYATLKEEHEAVRRETTGGGGGKGTNGEEERGVGGDKEAGVESEARQLGFNLEEGPVEGGVSDDELPISGGVRDEMPASSGSNLGPGDKPPIWKETPKSPRSGSNKGKSGKGEANVGTNHEGAPESSAARDQSLGGGAQTQSTQPSTSNGDASVASVGSRKAVKWTSDMLPLAQRPTLPPSPAEASSQETSEPANWVGSKIQGVGGRARGLLNYVAGIDSTE